MKKSFNIKGLHCRSCEIVTEKNLLKIPGVTKAMVDRRRGEGEIFSNREVETKDIEQAVNEAGYQLGRDETTFVTKDTQTYTELVIAGLITFVLFYILLQTKIFENSLVGNGSYQSLPLVFLIGLTAGISTCMALVGGIVLSLASKYSSDHPESDNIEKLKPHVFFNTGRIISFVILGSVIGYGGSIFQLPAKGISFMIILVSLLMGFLGLQLISIFPKLNKISFSLPKSFAKIANTKSDKQYSALNTFILGGLTFFLPCGFTQAMQAYSISSQSALTGGLTMGVFALGTAPGLLGIGAITSFAKGQIGRIFFKFAGIVVIIMAIFNISNALNLAGLKYSNSKSESAKVLNNIQEVSMTQKANGYVPNVFTIKKDVPVKWVVTSESSNSCASYLVADELNIKKVLNPGENVFEFTANKTGKIAFSCAMGMYSGYFEVVD